MSLVTQPFTSNYSIKILIDLLKSAESGKTTLLEQIRLLYKHNYTEMEFVHRKSFIYNNILTSIRKLIIRMQDTETPFENPDNIQYADRIMNEEDTQYACFTAEVYEAIQQVWHDQAVQKIYERRSEINLNDSSKYFLENLASINKLDYTPTPRDLIMSYVPTVGVQNVIFSADDHVFQLFDIGGQRIDRRKWATMYDGISAIFFCIAISEYDQKMDDDPEMVRNRLQDALALLEKISNEPKFQHTPLLLFLNEMDVFQEKLPLLPLGDHWPDYKGSFDALKFIEDLVHKATSGRDSSLIHIYRTCMIDTDAMKKILEKAFHAILKAT
ncbi:unnamed protein product [Haemonchus placei]|uniref:Uncharacterized protein n=1 Tax=Haemonchus placei TaxID=6290 RepID=A0A3P7VSP5_HAEPC|nr:unnamed protein product [Haemonchus placei]